MNQQELKFMELLGRH